MNNNDPMKRFGYIVFSICLFALSACTPHEQMDQEEGIVWNNDCCSIMERPTRLELATSTLARWRSAK